MEVKKPTAEQMAKFKKNAQDPSLSAEVRAKFQAIVDKFSEDVEDVEDKIEGKPEPKSRAGRKPATSRANKKPATPRATKKTATDIEKAKAEIKAKTGKTEEECEAIIEQYRALRTKAQEGKRKAEQATATNKKRVEKLENKGDLIEGTNVKTADAVIESTAKDVAEKIEQQIEAVEEKAEKEAKAEVAKDNTIKTPKDKKEAVKEKVDEKVKKETKVVVERVVIDTSALLTSIATSLGKFDKDSQKEFLIKLRSDIDKLLAKYAFGGMTDGATQVMNVQQSNMSSSSVNPTMFAKGGGVEEVGEAGNKKQNKEEKRFSVWVGGEEVNDYYLSEKEAKDLAFEYEDDGYDDVVIADKDEYARGGGVEVSKAESIKNAMYQAFESYLSNKTTDAQLVSKLQRILGSRRWFRYFKGDTGASDFGSVKRALSQSVNRDGEKESMQISIDTKGLQIYDYYGDEMFEDGGMVGQEIVFDYQGEEKTGVIKDVHNSGDYIVSTDDGRTLLAQRDRDVISLGKMREKASMEVKKKRFGFFEDGGNVSDLDYSDILAVLEVLLTDSVFELSNEFENQFNADGEEVEHESRDGFIAFTDGGYEVRWFESLRHYFTSGYSLPTKALEKEKDRQIDLSLEDAKDYFKNEYPEIVEELGEENIDYNSLWEAGYKSEAEDLSEVEMDMMDGTIMCEIGAYYYTPNNDRGIDGKHTLRLFGIVNLESPYHRSGNLEDRYDIDITFNSIEELEEQVEAGLKEITDWFNGSKYNESTKELRINRMAKGGLTEHGLREGDKIIKDFSNVKPNVISVMNDKKTHFVDLDKGNRFKTGGNVSSMLRNRRGM